MLGTEDADGPVGATDNVYGGVSEFTRTLALTTKDGNRSVRPVDAANANFVGLDHARRGLARQGDYFVFAEGSLRRLERSQGEM